MSSAPKPAPVFSSPARPRYRNRFLRIRKFSGGDALQGTLDQESVSGHTPAGASVAATAVRFEPVRFPHLQDIAEAAFDFANTAVQIAIGLIGVLALFLGLLKIAEAGGLIRQMSRIVEPLLRPLFPGIPKRASGLCDDRPEPFRQRTGLGNAATPLGIKAMEELQTLNLSRIRPQIPWSCCLQ